MEVKHIYRKCVSKKVSKSLTGVKSEGLISDPQRLDASPRAPFSVCINDKCSSVKSFSWFLKEDLNAVNN